MSEREKAEALDRDLQAMFRALEVRALPESLRRLFDELEAGEALPEYRKAS